jgi:hypothetical protein
MRKSRIVLGVLVAAALSTAALKQTGAADAARTVLYSLESGETIMRAESTMALALNATDVVLITTKGKGDAGPFFVLRDKARKGPFSNFKEAMAAAYAGRTPLAPRKRTCATYDPAAPPPGAALTPVAARGGQSMQFKGTTLGPHQMVLSTLVTPDGALAYVTSMDGDKAWLESSDGRKVSFGGTPGELKISPDGRNAAVHVQGRSSMSEMQAMSKLPPEKFLEAAKDMNATFLYTLDGKTYGPFDPFGGFWYAKTSSDLFFRVKDQVFRNGAPMLTISSFDPCNFYPSPDGKAYVVFDYANITFSDGKKYPSPLDVSAAAEGGRIVVRWLALENNKDLVVYQKAL